MSVYCWYVVVVDEADSTFLGHEGPYWFRADAESKLAELKRTGATESVILEVPYKRPEELRAMNQEVHRLRCVARHFWGGSFFYPGTLEHCVALPMEKVPEPMLDRIIEKPTPHFRFSPVAAPVKQTYSSLPGYAISHEWKQVVLELGPNGFWFRYSEDPPRKCPIGYSEPCASQWENSEACRYCNTNLSTGVPDRFRRP